MKNNKGFVLMETIIVMSVLSLALVTLYSQYVKIMSNSKSRNYYDTPQALYIADNIKKAYIQLGAYLNDSAETPDKKATIIKKGNNITITCYNSLTTYNKNAVCNTITNKMLYQSSSLKKAYNAFNIEAIYVMKASDFKNNNNLEENVLPFFDGSTIGYLKSIDRSEINKENTNKDLIIVKIKTNNGYIFGRSEREV